MAGERWEEAKASLKGVADIAAQYDDDGIDIYFLNSKRVGTELRVGALVGLAHSRTLRMSKSYSRVWCRKALLRESTVFLADVSTGARLDAILQKYLSRLEKAKSYDETVKPLNLIIVTDGSESNPIHC